MATQTITLTYPDGQGARIMAALKDSAISREIPSPTNAEALTWFAAGVKNRLRDIVMAYEHKNAVAAAAASVIPVDVT